MCGIAGSTGDADGSLAAAMSQALVHRGPDDSGAYTDGALGVSIAARRLSILDVAGGHQPMESADRSIVVAQNGELYNAPALADGARSRGRALRTHCDTELLIPLYEEFGERLVDHLDGMYAFVVLDRARRRLLLARDRYGEKPLFYHCAGGTLTFASELTALLRGLPATPGLDREQLDAYFVLGYVPGPRTLLEDVLQVPPGHLLEWDLDARAGRLVRYWEPPRTGEVAPRSFEETVEAVGELLRESIRTRLHSDVPLGVFLSGGLDSALVASLACEASAERVKTFTVGYDVGAVNETSAARLTAKALGTDHHELLLRSDDLAALAGDVFARLDQPIADQALIASHAVAKLARESVTVAVGGEGADELFGGYPRYRWLARTAALHARTPAAIRRPLAGVLGALPAGSKARQARHLVADADLLGRHLDWVSAGRVQMRARLYDAGLRASFGSTALREWTALPENRNGDLPAALMALDQRLWLPDDVLAKADRASMLTSLEVRTPFLEPRIAAAAASLPTGEHLKDGGKRVLREITRRRFDPARPSPKKVAFRVPAADWLRGPLLPLLRERLAGGALYSERLVRHDAVDSLVAEHVAGHDRSGTLWPLLVLACWLDRL